MEKRLKYRQISIVYSTSPGLSQACRLTEADSTQPQDSAIGNVNTNYSALTQLLMAFGHLPERWALNPQVMITTISTGPEA